MWEIMIASLKTFKSSMLIHGIQGFGSPREIFDFDQRHVHHPRYTVDIASQVPSASCVM